MKTFSGKSNSINIDESILNSTNSGLKPYVEEFCSKTMKSTEYSLHPDLSISLLNSKQTFTNKPSIPCWIRDCDTVHFYKCTFTNYTLPESARKVIFEECKELKTLVAKAGSSIQEIEIIDCGNIDFTELGANLKVKKVKISKSDITTLKGLQCAQETLVVTKCPELEKYDLPETDLLNLRITHAKIKSFENKVTANSAVFSGLPKATKLSIEVSGVQDFSIDDCGKLKSLVISGDQLDTLVVDDCGKLESIEVVDCKRSASFCNLPEISEYKLPNIITGYCIFEKVKTIPEVQCKKVLIRK